MICILPADQQLPQAGKTALPLSPSHSREEPHATLQDAISDGGAVLLALEGERPVGFAQCALRRDYVEGSSTSPVGYLEGVFVLQEYRRRGIARRLVEACQSWAQLQGCKEFASDCELDNLESQRFHQACGFAEVNRIVCFLKK